MAIQAGYVIVLTSNELGQGSSELGGILIQKLLHTIAQDEILPEKVILLNSSVKLTVKGTPSVEILNALQKRHVDIAACGTCVNFYHINETMAVGRVSTMEETVTALRNAVKTVTF